MRFLVSLPCGMKLCDPSVVGNREMRTRKKQTFLTYFSQFSFREENKNSGQPKGCSTAKAKHCLIPAHNFFFIFYFFFAEALNTLKEERPALKVDWAPLSVSLTLRTAFALVGRSCSRALYGPPYTPALPLRDMCKTWRQRKLDGVRWRSIHFFFSPSGPSTMKILFLEIMSKCRGRGAA